VTFAAPFSLGGTTVAPRAEVTSEFCFVYSTFPDKDSALNVARVLIDKKLAACVNIYPPMTSVYMWDAKREEAAEFGAFIKTRRALAEAAIAAAWDLHPYTVPCFVVLPIEAGNPDYLAWVREQTELPVAI
jgi:periplasmic divalent cation tolerance protein